MTTYIDVTPVFKALTNLSDLQINYLEMKIGNDAMQKLALNLCADDKDIFDKLLQ